MIGQQLFQKGALVLLLGDVDTGKTTMCRWLVTEAAQAGFRVGVVDSDIGQSWIGPPTTIGTKVLSSNANITERPDAIYFVGAISPDQHIPEMLIGLRQMVDACWQMDADVVIVDTTGYVSNSTALMLKSHKIDLLHPDHVVAIERTNELTPLLHRYRGVTRPEFHRVKRSRQVSRKSRLERRRYRDVLLTEYFRDAPSVMVNLHEVALHGCPLGSGRIATQPELGHLSQLAETLVLHAEWSYQSVVLVPKAVIPTDRLQYLRAHLSRSTVVQQSPDSYQHCLVGVCDSDGATKGVGLIVEANWQQASFAIKTPVSAASIHMLTVGSYHWVPNEKV